LPVETTLAPAINCNTLCSHNSHHHHNHPTFAGP
jgi:hypothetical protein